MPMSSKKHKPEELIGKLREAEIALIYAAISAKCADDGQDRGD